MKSEIPVICLQRLPIYLNYLKSLGDSEEFISSGAIAHALGMGEVLVRKDLAFTSAQGRTRVGYRRTELIAALEDFLGCNTSTNAAIIGAGGLGSALMAYGGFKNYGIEIVAAFDNDPKKVGTEIAGKPVLDMAGACEEVKTRKIELCAVCVPAQYAQDVADLLVKCGVKAILNFAPVLLRVPEGYTVRNMDLAANMAVLASLL